MGYGSKAGGGHRVRRLPGGERYAGKNAAREFGSLLSRPAARRLSSKETRGLRLYRVTTPQRARRAWVGILFLLLLRTKLKIKVLKVNRLIMPFMKGFLLFHLLSSTTVAFSPRPQPISHHNRVVSLCFCSPFKLVFDSRHGMNR